MTQENKSHPSFVCVLGLTKEEARKRLRAADALVTFIDYTSKKGVPNADSIRVIRQRTRDDGCIELVVSPCRVCLQED